MNSPIVEQRAELLDTNFTNLGLGQVKAEVDLINELRPNLARYVYHTSLNFSKDEEGKLNNDMLVNIAHDYLNGLGFTDNQYFIFRHYDADHPHVHLLVNRICFDGRVISDSNNYKRSESVVRTLESKYGLTPVSQSKNAVERAPKKNEIEKTLRTGTPSDKMVLQQKLKRIIGDRYTLISSFIELCEKEGIHLLFNQASTGRVTGITYFYDGFKIKGQALGNQFKWAELTERIYYEQNRDREAISEANGRTRAIYGELINGRPGENGRGEEGSSGLSENLTRGSSNVFKQSADARRFNAEGGTSGERALDPGPDVDMVDNISAGDEYRGALSAIHIEITDDIDDEAILGKKRKRKVMTRTQGR